MKKSSFIFFILFILIVICVSFFEFKTKNPNKIENAELTKNIDNDVQNSTNYEKYDFKNPNIETNSSNLYKTEIEELIKNKKINAISKINSQYEDSKKIYSNFEEQKNVNISSKEKLCNEKFYDYIFDLRANDWKINDTAYEIFSNLEKNDIETKEFSEITTDVTSKSKEIRQYILKIYGYCNCLYKKTDIISIDEYLHYDKTEEDWKTLTLNDNKDVIFKNKVVLNEYGIPINNQTAYTTIEIKIYLAAAGVEPKEGCDPADTINNGTLGCYIDNPDE